MHQLLHLDIVCWYADPSEGSDVAPKAPSGPQPFRHVNPSSSTDAVSSGSTETTQRVNAVEQAGVVRLDNIASVETTHPGLYRLRVSDVSVSCTFGEVGL